MALQRGEPSKAVQYLEKALEKEPENAAIRTDLSTAMLQVNEVNIVKMISVIEAITGDASDQGLFGKAAVLSKSYAAGCNFEESRKVEQIILSDNPAYQEIEAVVEELRRVHELLQPIIESQSKLDELTEAQRQTALLNSAISEVLLVLVEIEHKKDELGAALWRLDNRDVGLCARDGAALHEMQSFVKCDQIPRLQSALELLKKRSGAVSDGDSGAKKAIDELQENIDLLEAQIEVTCS